MKVDAGVATQRVDPQQNLQGAEGPAILRGDELTSLRGRLRTELVASAVVEGTTLEATRQLLERIYQSPAAQRTLGSAVSSGAGSGVLRFLGPAGAVATFVSIVDAGAVARSGTGEIAVDAYDAAKRSGDPRQIQLGILGIANAKAAVMSQSNDLSRVEEKDWDAAVKLRLRLQAVSTQFPGQSFDLQQLDDGGSSLLVLRRGSTVIPLMRDGEVSDWQGRDKLPVVRLAPPTRTAETVQPSAPASKPPPTQAAPVDTPTPTRITPPTQITPPPFQVETSPLRTTSPSMSDVSSPPVDRDNEMLRYSRESASRTQREDQQKINVAWQAATERFPLTADTGRFTTPSRPTVSVREEDLDRNGKNDYARSQSAMEVTQQVYEETRASVARFNRDPRNKEQGIAQVVFQREIPLGNYETIRVPTVYEGSLTEIAKLADPSRPNPRFSLYDLTASGIQERVREASQMAEAGARLNRAFTLANANPITLAGVTVVQGAKPELSAGGSVSEALSEARARTDRSAFEVNRRSEDRTTRVFSVDQQVRVDEYSTESVPRLVRLNREQAQEWLNKGQLNHQQFSRSGVSPEWINERTTVSSSQFSPAERQVLPDLREFVEERRQEWNLPEAPTDEQLIEALRRNGGSLEGYGETLNRIMRDGGGASKLPPGGRTGAIAGGADEPVPERLTEVETGLREANSRTRVITKDRAPTSPEDAAFARFREQTELKGVNERDAKALFDIIKPSDHYTGRLSPKYTNEMVRQAIDFGARNPDVPVYFVQAEVPSNLGALNKKLGPQDVNNLLTRLAGSDRVLTEAVEAKGGSITITQGRGSTLNISISGLSHTDAKAALDSWQRSVNENIEKLGREGSIRNTDTNEIIVPSQLRHPKNPNLDGTPEGINVRVSQLNPLSRAAGQIGEVTPAQVLQTADKQLAWNFGSSGGRPTEALPTGNFSRFSYARFEELKNNLDDLRSQTDTPRGHFKDTFEEMKDRFTERAVKTGMTASQAEKIYRTNVQSLDSISGALTSDALDGTVRNAIQYSRTGRVSMMEIDVPNVGGSNATIGMNLTDEILAAPAMIIERELRQEGIPSKVIRAGGDEFVILAECSIEKMREIARRAEMEVAKLNTLEANVNSPSTGSTTVRVGDAEHPKHRGNRAFYGTGLYSGIIELNPNMTPASARKLTGDLVEKAKADKARESGETPH